MSIYSDALTSFLDGDEKMRQADLAEKAKVTQAAISRYKAGRLPQREIAERIDRATDGRVPLSLWRVVAAKQFGLAA